MPGLPHRRRHPLTTIGLTAAAALGVLQVLGRTSGSRADERRASLPGDEVVRQPTVVTDHAVTINATPDRVWPWLTQMGWHRAGWYTPPWVDQLLFSHNNPSADYLVPEFLRDLAVGDILPDGPPGTAEFVVHQVQAPHLLVLHSTTHAPAAWRYHWGAGVDWTWTFHLTPAEGAQTRVHLRVRGRTGPWWLTALYVVFLVPADHVMAHGMLVGLRRRVEATASSPVRQPTDETGERTA